MSAHGRTTYPMHHEWCGTMGSHTKNQPRPKPCCELIIIFVPSSAACSYVGTYSTYIHIYHSSRHTVCGDKLVASQLLDSRVAADGPGSRLTLSQAPLQFLYERISRIQLSPLARLKKGTESGRSHRVGSEHSACYTTINICLPIHIMQHTWSMQQIAFSGINLEHM